VNERFYIIDYINPYFDVVLGRGIQKKYSFSIYQDDGLYQKTKKKELKE